jgi:hypothetical protein
MGVVVPSNLKQLLFHDNNVAQPAYYTPQELTGSGLPHDAFLKDYSLGKGSLRPKRQGYCYNFDGVNDYVNLGDVTFLDGLAKFSISAWFYYDGQSNQKAILSKGSYFILNQWFFGFTHSGQNRFGYSVGQRYKYQNITGMSHGWKHVVLTYDSVNSLDGIYINNAILSGEGIIQGGNYLPTVNNGEILCIGSVTQSNGATVTSYFDGKLSDVRIYNDALTPDEVTYLYTGGQSGINPGRANLVAHYPLQEESGPRAYDTSGNGHHGTIMNATTSGVGSIHVVDEGVPKSYLNDEGYSVAFTKDDTFITNVSGIDNTISFNIKIADTDTVGIALTNSSINAFLFCWQQNGTGVVNVSSGSPTVLVDGVNFTGNRGDLFNILADQEFHVVEIMGADFTANWVSGLYFGGYPSSPYELLAGTVMTNLLINGVAYSGPTIIPAASTTQDALGGTLTYTGEAPLPGLAKGYAWQGDGTSIEVDLGSPIIPTTADFELEFWYQHKDTGTTKKGVFQQLNNPDNCAVIANNGIANALQLYIDFADATSAVNITTAAAGALVENVWYRINIQREGSAFVLSVYEVSGSLWFTGTQTRSISSAISIVSNTRLLRYLSDYGPFAVGPVSITTGGVTTTYSPVPGTRNVAVTKSDGTYSVINNAVVNGTLANLYTLGNGSWRLPEIENGAHWDGTALYPASPGAEVAANGEAINVPANKHPRSVLVDRTGAVIIPLDTAMGTDELTAEAFDTNSLVITDMQASKRFAGDYYSDRYGAALVTIDDLEFFGENPILQFALVDRDGAYILDRDGAYIIADPTPRTS